jgi:aminopeptidase N
LRGFSAPVKLEYDRSLEELAFLASHDPDTFNRWEAGQQLASSLILGLAADYRAKRELELNPIMLSAFEAMLVRSGDDLSYLSLLMTLPATKYLAELMGVIDIEAIHRAREFVKRVLAEHLQDSLWQLYKENNVEESGRFDSQAIGRRRLKNCCLGYLSMLDNSASYECAEQQFESAQNMTDQMAALGVIVNSKHPARQQCLNSFYQQWSDDALVVDKWFTIQAICTLDNAFAGVQELMSHPAFDLKNPNRIRSLIGAFSQGNQLHFHAESGQGYQFLADQIIVLNKINPQIAARLSSALTQWRRYDQDRQKLMTIQLERIINSPEICKDGYEVVSKSLVTAS